MPADVGDIRGLFRTISGLARFIESMVVPHDLDSAAALGEHDTTPFIATRRSTELGSASPIPDMIKTCVVSGTHEH